MFRILCLTSGDYIKIGPYGGSTNIEYKMPRDIQKETVFDWSSSWHYLEFTTERAANWFLSHRLVYNPKRTDSRKLENMRNLFEYNNVPGFMTCKLEFEIIKA